MALIVEDGSGVAGANSYVSLTSARAHAQARGQSLPADEAAAEAVILKAMDYLESFADRLKGEQVERDQALSWPRYDVEIGRWCYQSDEIPKPVTDALLALILEVSAGEDPRNPSSATPPVIRETVGPITTEYAEPATNRSTVVLPSTVLLKRLLRYGGSSLVRG